MGFPQPGPGGGSGLANAYAFLTDGTHTATAAGADTIDFVSPDGSILFTVVPGSPGTVQAKANVTPKAHALLTLGQQAAVPSINVAASLIGGAQLICPANTILAGDVINIRAAGTMFNNSGAASTMSITLVFNNPLSSTIQATLVTLSVASAATSTRAWYVNFYFVMPTAGAGLTGWYSLDGPVSAANANQIVLASTWFTTGSFTYSTTAQMFLDVQCASSVNNANTNGQLNMLAVTKLSL